MGRYTGWIRVLVASLAAAVLLAFLYGPVGFRLKDAGLIASVELAPWLPDPSHGAFSVPGRAGTEDAALQRFREGHRLFARVSLTNRSSQTAKDVIVEFSQIVAPTVMLMASDGQASPRALRTNRLTVPDIAPGETAILAVWSAAEPVDASRPGMMTGESSLGTFEVAIADCCGVPPRIESGWEIFTSGWFPKVSILLGLALLAVVAAGFVFWRKYAAALLSDPEYYARERHRRGVNARFVARLPAEDPMAQPSGRS